MKPRRPTPPRYYLLFERYSEYNQFEGSWNWGHSTHTTLAGARVEHRVLSAHSDYRNVSPVLRPVASRP